LPVVLGYHSEGPWIKALAVADALRKTDAEILIVADADVWATGLQDALQAVCVGARWAMPHRGLLRLSEAATERWVAGGAIGEAPPAEQAPHEASLVAAPPYHELAEPAYLGMEGGGIVLLRRETYEACPLDPRFTGWGCEDDSWGVALRTLYGPPRRIKEPLIHLFHPPPQRMTRSYGSLEGRELRKRYIRARGSPTAMRALIEEAHDAHVSHEPHGHDRAPHSGRGQ
jgi:hypothetical protein